ASAAGRERYRNVRQSSLRTSLAFIYEQDAPGRFSSHKVELRRFGRRAWSAGFVVLRLRLGDVPRLLSVSRFEHIPAILDQVLQPVRRQAQGGGIRGLNVG
ncbi:MAG: hypothetical protein ACJ8DX_06365, partial [Xanthobacteraceae bacterium]